MSPSIGTPTVREAVAVFEDAGSLQAAIDELLGSGFDRAELSLVAGERTVEAKLGHAYRKVEELEDDPQVPRTAYVSTEAIGDAEGGLIGGLFYLGAVTAAGGMIASGGTMAGAILAAVLAGGAGGFAGSALARLIDYHHADYLKQQLDHGGLLLWVRTRDHEHEERARRILERHAAHDVHVHTVSATEFLEAHPRAGFVERALLDPTAVFEAPEDVLKHPDLNDEQKVLILRRWAYDARELETADDEGMRGETPDMLGRVLEALRTLEPPR